MKKLIIIASILFIGNICAEAQKKESEYASRVFGKSEQISILTVTFEKGKSHNHPLMAIWLADANGKYLQTLYVSESIGKGYFKRADHSKGMWEPGAIQRPAALPYWVHQRAVTNEYGTYLPTPAHPVPDAYTGATPTGSFTYHFITDHPLNGKYKVFLEINQSWDWNNFWHNSKYPGDKEYTTSSQPAVVYEAEIDTAQPKTSIPFRLAGHSHYSGQDGQLYSDTSTLTTALRIVGHCTVTLE